MPFVFSGDENTFYNLGNFSEDHFFFCSIKVVYFLNRKRSNKVIPRFFACAEILLHSSFYESYFMNHISVIQLFSQHTQSWFHVENTTRHQKGS